MIKKTLYKIFGTRNERLLKGYRKTVGLINQLEPVISQLSDEQLQTKTIEFKQRYQNGEKLQQLLPEVFAVCREASRRVLNMRHFDVQLIGGMVLNDGKIAEMRTGEGKTLVATLPAYLNAIADKGVHVVTVNDYLAKRDATELSKLYNFLGLSVGVNLPDMSPEDKKAAYVADITYGTNNEFGFDYLRDNMVFDQEDKVQRSLNFAIVDEVDSILIDEARTPLIISGPAEGSDDLYTKLNKVPPLLTPQTEEKSDTGDFWVDEKNNNVILSEAGHEKVEQIMLEMGLLKEGDSLYNVSNISLVHHLLASLKAHYVYHKDQQYVVQDGEIVIVDEFTGRLMSGRRWSDGLHQAVEAKEGVEIQRENQTMATITFQNYFRMYKKLSGMTGTADTEAYEFQQIYNLETVVIPTNKLMIRKDSNDKIYMNLEDKYNAIVDDIRDCHERGQPVLVGTTSVENSEILAKLLTAAKLKHEVLNAKQHAREADIIVQAGSPGGITVATNMAGRGTDIILGGNPKPQINFIKTDAKLSEEQKQAKIDEITAKWQELNKTVLDAGGLHIIGTERHESRRIDNQLRGRSGRQGDPGSSRFYLSLDDPLLRIFGGERMRSMMQRLGMAKGESIEHKWLTRSIESAQRKVEGHNFDIRKQLLDYDDVSNEQRRVIYQQRDEILAGENLSDITLGMINGVLDNLFDTYIPHKSMPEDWDLESIDAILKNEYLLDYSIKDKLESNPRILEADIKAEILQLATDTYKNKMTEFAIKIERDIQNFAYNVIGEDKATWNISALDDFCSQNGIIVDKKFAAYVSEQPEITREELLAYFAKSAIEPSKAFQITRFERGILLQHIDYYWREHLTQLEQLRQGIHLRGYAQKDPKQEYKQEAFNLFSDMLDGIKRDAAKVLLTVRLQGINDIPDDDIEALAGPQMIHQNAPAILQPNVVTEGERPISRNAPCPCGSGKKYKHCHGKLA
jgi:preprotein translocase subunit SecA